MAEEGTLGAHMQRMLTACAPEVDRRLAGLRGTTFHPLHELFDAETEDVFLDHYGHVTETANERIAAAITQRLAGILRE